MIDYRSYMVHDDHNVKGFFEKYRFLSNYHVAPVYFEGLEYPSTEHAYHAAKTPDVSTRKILFMTGTPNESKKTSRSLVVRDDWFHVKFDVMSSVVFDKFYRHLDLRAELLATGNRHLEETNHWKDVYWGVCDGRGENNLGKVLMGVRAYWAVKYPEMLGRPVTNIKPLF